MEVQLHQDKDEEVDARQIKKHCNNYSAFLFYF